MQVAHHYDPTPPTGLSPPHKDEDPGWLAEVSKERVAADKLDCAIPFADEQPGADAGKALATLRARLALAGWALLLSESGGSAPMYLVTRWGHGRELRDLAAVEAFAVQVGAPC